MGIFKLNGIDYMGGGGGGNANERVLTWAEYCALTEEEKTNGTTYYINDINGEGKDQFQPVIYSEEEREIGVWTDGRPLYQKTWNFNAISGSTASLSLGIANINEINICPDGSNINKDIPLPYVHSNTQNIIGCFFVIGTEDTTLELRIGQYMVGYVNSVCLTARYTKTTDTPGSGTWTPQGVPTVHYSTDEHVIGTWIDGSTLYEKSYHVPTVTSTYTTIDSTINTSTVKIRDVSMGTIIVGGAYNNAQYVDGRMSYTSFIRVILGPGLSVGMEAPPSESVTDFDFTIRYTKSTS